MRTLEDILKQILGSKDFQIAGMQARIEELEAQLAKEPAKPTLVPKEQAG